MHADHFRAINDYSSQNNERNIHRDWKAATLATCKAVTLAIYKKTTRATYKEATLANL